jgi:hypothetical protein
MGMPGSLGLGFLPKIGSNTGPGFLYIAINIAAQALLTRRQNEQPWGRNGSHLYGTSKLAL